MMTGWSKSQLQIIEYLGIDMWHQSLNLREGKAHDKAFASMMAEVGSQPKPVIKQPPVENPVVAPKAQSIQTSQKPATTTAVAIENSEQTTLTSSAKSAPSIDKITLTPATKYSLPASDTWGMTAKQINAEVQPKRLNVFDNDEGALDLLVIHWASKSPSELEFVKQFSENCFTQLGSIGISQVLAVAFQGNGLHQLEPTADDKAAIITEIKQIVERQSPAKILLCGAALSRTLLETDCPLYKLRQQLFFFGQRKIPTSVSIDFASIGKAPKLKVLLWDDFKYLAQASD